MCILGELNGWIGDRTKAGLTGAFGVPGENDNGRRKVEFCTERGLCREHILSTEVCISTRMARGQDVVEIKTMIDVVLVKRNMLQYMQDMRNVRGMG